MSTQPTTQQSTQPQLAPQPQPELNKSPAQLAEEQWVLILQYLRNIGLVDENHPCLLPSAFTPIPPDSGGRQLLVQIPIMTQINQAASVGSQMRGHLNLAMMMSSREFVELLHMDQAATEYDLRLRELCDAFISTVMAPASECARSFVLTYGADGFTSFSKREFGMNPTSAENSMYFILLEGIDKRFDHASPVSSLGLQAASSQSSTAQMIPEPPSLIL
ncbi:hypothetical protein DXG01_016442 [Tephrocybe rancida]|nr:hypothetical protein DXG01_016442 [Tephrocybe rancida]